MATQAQISANRRNSQASTGPRTPAGKIAASRNATRTGLYAKSLLIDGEDPAALAALEQDYLDSCDPQGALENALVSELIRCEWLLRRMGAIESQLWNASGARVRDLTDFKESLALLFTYNRIDDRLVILQRRVDSLSRSYRRALHDLTRLQSLRAKRPAAPAAPAPPVAEIGFVPSNVPAARSAAPAAAPRSPLLPPANVLNLPSSYSRQIATQSGPPLSSSCPSAPVGSALFV